MAAAPISLNDAMTSALESMNKTSVKEPEAKVEPKEETTTEETSTEEETTEPVEEAKKNEPTSEEIQEALNLTRALKDPQLAPALIEYLATRSGFTKSEVLKATPKEQKEIVKEIAAILPPGFEYLEESLVPAIKRLIKEGVETETKDLRASVAQDNVKRLEKVVLDTTTEFGKLHYDGKDVPNSVILEVNRLSNIYLPTPGTDPKEHVMNLLNLAKARVDPNNSSSTKVVTKKVTTPSVKNQLSSQKTATDSGSSNTKPKLSLDDSIQEALKAMQL